MVARRKGEPPERLVRMLEDEIGLRGDDIVTVFSTLQKVRH